MPCGARDVSCVEGLELSFAPTVAVATPASDGAPVVPIVVSACIDYSERTLVAWSLAGRKCKSMFKYGQSKFTYHAILNTKRQNCRGSNASTYS